MLSTEMYKETVKRSKIVTLREVQESWMCQRCVLVTVDKEVCLGWLGIPIGHQVALALSV